MKRIFITLLVLFGLSVGGTYFYLSNALAPGDVPAKVMSAEEAVATSGTIAIASIDMRYVRRIDNMLNGEKDPLPLGEPKPAETLFEKLQKQGVNLFSDTDYALTTINVTQDKPAYSFVLFGRFSLDNLKQAVRQYYLVDESASDYWLIEKIPEQKKKNDPCEVKKTSARKIAPLKQALHFQNDRILVSSPELMPVLLKRFADKARADVSLGKWRQFRKDKVVAGVFMSPEEAKKGAVDLPSAILLGAVSKQPLKALYGGAAVRLLPSPALTVLVDAHANESTWPHDFKTKYDAWLNETVGDLKEMPTLASLIQSLNVKADGNILRMNTMADSTTITNLEKVPAEFFRMIFSGMTINGQKAESSTKEQIVKNEDIEKYAPQFDFSSIQPFDRKKAFYTPDVMTGPFAVRLRKIGLLATDDSIIELTINAEGKGFENLSGEMMHKSDELPAASLSITSVEDKEGINLLREELCGKTRNLAKASLNYSRDKEYVDGKWISKSLKVSDDKTVRLKQNVSLSQVAKIKGKVAIRAATQIKVQILQAPFSGKTIETDKVRMYLKTSISNTVKYQLSGDITHVMAVRAKNAKGQYLAESGSSGSGDGETKTVSKRFKGQVASIEVIVAEKMESKDYPFVINTIALRYGKPGNEKQKGVQLTSKKDFLRKYAKVEFKDACKDKQKVMLDGFVVCLNNFGSQWGQQVGGEFEVYAPAADALQKNLAAAELRIDSVLTDNGEEIAFDKSEKLSLDYRFDSRYDGKQWVNYNERLHASYVRMYSDNKALKDKKVSMVKGTLTIRLPKRPKYFDLDADKLGVIKKTKNGIIANISAYEDWSTYIDLQGPVDKVMRLMPLAKDGSILTTMNDRINEKQYRTWGMSKEDKKKVESLPKKWVGMISIYGKPEVIRVYYADDFDVIKHQFQFTIKQ